MRPRNGEASVGSSFSFYKRKAESNVSLADGQIFSGSLLIYRLSIGELGNSRTSRLCNRNRIAEIYERIFMGTKSGGILFCRKAIVPPITSTIPIERLAYKAPRNLSKPMNYYDIRNRRLPPVLATLLASGMCVRV